MLNIVIGIIVACGCGRNELQVPSSLNRVPSTEGFLYLSPDSHQLVTGGILSYRIYETGEIFYAGDVSYFGAPDTIGEVQVPFYGRIQVAPEDVASASYRMPDNVRSIQKISAQVKDVDKATQTSRIFVQVVDPEGADSSDAKGYLELATDEEIVKIMSADLIGTIFEDTPSEVQIRLKLSQSKGF